jgi:hypothetical protein
MLLCHPVCNLITLIASHPVIGKSRVKETQTLKEKSTKAFNGPFLDAFPLHHFEEKKTTAYLNFLL